MMRLPGSELTAFCPRFRLARVLPMNLFSMTLRRIFHFIAAGFT